MKDTGIIRRIDNLGRFVVPSEMRAMLDIAPDDEIEIFVEGDKIILKKHQPACTLCRSCASLITYKNKLLCKSCIESIKTEL